METRILSVAIAIWLAALGVLVAMRILNGSISTDGLLSVRAGGDASPERIQLLIASLIGVAVYIADVLSKSSTGTLPDVPATLLTVMAGMLSPRCCCLGAILPRLSLLIEGDVEHGVQLDRVWRHAVLPMLEVEKANTDDLYWHARILKVPGGAEFFVEFGPRILDRLEEWALLADAAWGRNLYNDRIA